MPLFENLIGQQFGRWLVLEKAKKRENRRDVYWSVICTCGSSKSSEVSTWSLNSGESKSCGCLQKEAASKIAKTKFIDLTGKVFGRITVLRQLNSPNAYTKWQCVCSCNTDKVLIFCGKYLRAGTQSCGCLKAEDARKRKLKRPYEAAYNLLVQGARKRDLIVELTYEDYIRFTTTKNCTYCTRVLNWAPWKIKGKPFGSNIDRIDNKIGYTLENCVPSCGVCNRLKMDLPEAEWRVVCTALRQYERDKCQS